ncbi:MAG TPA: DUF1552 domain-containing protein [Polyangiaceae bacterium]|nr:DUF1552 domain-containing protein [Polyangiaceae bacterium]
MHKLSRRQLTLSASAGLLLAPFAAMLREGTTRAGTTKQAKRLLVFCTMGTKPDAWKPTVSGETISAWSAMTQPLSAIKDNVLLVEGCPAGHPGEGHGSNAGLTGQGNGYFAVNNVVVPAISVDQFVADKLVKSGINRPLASLVLGADTTGGVTLSYRAGKAVAPIASPASAFATAFGGLSTGSTSTPTTGTTPAPDAALKRRQSILKLVSGEITSLQGRLGATEKAKLDAHLDSIHTLENKLMASSSSGGGGGNPNAAKACAGLAKPKDSTGTHPAIANDLLHLDILVNALACDITRVGVIQFGSDQGLQVDLPNLQGDQHNGFIHSGSGENFKSLIAFEAWLATQFANVVNSLKTKPDPDGGSGTLYDSTLVLWARDMGDAVNHDMNDMRFVLAGGAGGYLKQAAGGRYLNAGGGAANRHERVLLNVLEAFGITDYKGFGDPDFSGKSPLPGIAAT